MNTTTPILSVLLLASFAAAQTPGIQSRPASAHAPTTRAALGHPWPMRYGDPARTGRSAWPGAQSGVLDWKFRIAGVVPQFAAAADGSVHCGTVFHEEWWSNESFVYALTPAGALEWRAKIEPYPWGASQGVGGSPALDALENVVTPGAAGKLHDFAPDGLVRWSYAGNGNTVQNSSPAVLPDGSIRHFMSGHGLVGLANGGAQIFRTTGVSTQRSSVAVAANGEMAMSAVRSNEPHTFPAIYYFNADGTLRWMRTTLRGEDSTPAIGDDGTVYAQFDGTTAFRPDNTIVWAITTGATTRALGRNGVLYLNVGNSIRRVDAATGVEIGSIPLPGGANDGMPIDSAGNVYVTTSNGYACAYTSTGTPIFEVRLADAFTTGPVIASGARLVAAGSEGFTKYVYSIR
jgi:hypothetical protein